MGSYFRIWICVAWLTGQPFLVSAQKLTYQIFMGKDSIGLMYAEHKQTPTSHNYDRKNNIKIKINTPMIPTQPINVFESVSLFVDVGS